jgi:hypothetical protein
MAREMGRGHTIGEMSLFTGEPRAATVVAIRDSVLVRLPKPEFDRILASSAQLSIALTRQIIGHLRDAKPRSDLARPVMIGIVPVTARVDPRAFAEQLAGHLRRHGRVRVLDAATVDRELREEGLAQREHGDAQADRRVALLLEEIEAGHDFVLLVGRGHSGAVATATNCCCSPTRASRRRCTRSRRSASTAARSARRRPRSSSCCTGRTRGRRAARARGSTGARSPTTCTSARRSRATWRGSRGS